LGAKSTPLKNKRIGIQKLAKNEKRVKCFGKKNKKSSGERRYSGAGLEEPRAISGLSFIEQTGREEVTGALRNLCYYEKAAQGDSGFG
jgi:hypothetical protein